MVAPTHLLFYYAAAVAVFVLSTFVAWLTYTLDDFDVGDPSLTGLVTLLVSLGGLFAAALFLIVQFVRWAWFIT